jgi:ubiquinone/menaquinone biosynthesis C-methylase UbiE
MEKREHEENPFEYSNIAQEWIDAIENEKGGAREKEVYPMLYNWVNDNHFQKVLEVGAGQGICSPFIMAEYIGVEPSQTLIDRAKKLYPEKIFMKGSSYGLPLGDASVDGAFSVGVWFHIENIDDAHRELSRVLKPKGKIMIITSNPETHNDWESLFITGTKVGNKLDGAVKLPTTIMSRNVFYLHTKEDITSSLEKNGFQIEGIKTFGYDAVNVEEKGLGFWIAIEAQKM